MSSYARIPLQDVTTTESASPDRDNVSDMERRETAEQQTTGPDRDSRYGKHITPPVSPKAPTMSAKWPHLKRPYWWVALGDRSILLVLVGTSIIIASCAILLYLWIGTSITADGDPPPFWRTIAERGSAPQVVTICAAAVRTAVLLQLGVVTAALAAIIIESGTSFDDIASISIKRASGSGPFDLIASGRVRGRHGQVPTILSVITVIVLVTSTFFSTILLSDFIETEIPALPVQTDISTSIGWRDFELQSAQSWKNMPAATWRFAEREPTGDIGNATHDTGDTIRAMLPFIDASLRTSLTYYEGPAPVSNMRTYCYAPEDDDLVDFAIVGGDPWRFNVAVNATFLLRPVAPMMEKWFQRQDQDSPLKTFFECEAVGVGDDSGILDWPISMCPAWMSWHVDGFSMTPLIIINSTGALVTNGARPFRLDDYILDDPIPLKANKRKGDGVWTPVAVRDTDIFNLSVCLVGVGSKTLNVTMTGPSIFQEPLPKWEQRDGFRASGWNTDLHSRQSAGLGEHGRPLSLHDRGLLRLMLDTDGLDGFQYFESSPDGLEVERNRSSYWTPEDPMPLTRFMLFNHTSENDSGYPTDLWHPHSLYIFEFQDILQKTQNLPLAVQALLTRLWQTTFYSRFLEEGNTLHSAKAVFSETILLPKNWTGISITLTMIAVHICLLLVTISLFIMKTEASELWNPWKAVAQVISLHTKDALGVADSMSGKDLKKWMATGDSRLGLYGVIYSSVSERRQLELLGMKPELRRRG